MTDLVDEPVPSQREDDGLSPPATPIKPRHWVVRRWFPVLAGAVAGVLLGLWAYYSASQGGFLAYLYLLAPITVSGLLFVILLIVGALARRSEPIIAALTAAGAFLLVWNIAPPAERALRSGQTGDVTQGAAGTGTDGTRADPAALWSGPVSCFWQNEDTAIAEVDGFDVPITDAAFLAAGRLLDGKGIALDGKVISVDLDGELDLGGDHYTVFPVGLEGVSSDRRTGTAVFNAPGEIIIRWTCSGGP